MSDRDQNRFRSRSMRWKILSGAWEGTVGTVQSMNEQKKSLSINVELFGRDTPVELSFSEVKKMD